MTKSPGKETWLLSLPDNNKLTAILHYLLKETEFLSPYGIRALSKVGPYTGNNFRKGSWVQPWTVIIMSQIERPTVIKRAKFHVAPGCFGWVSKFIVGVCLSATNMVLASWFPGHVKLRLQVCWNLFPVQKGSLDSESYSSLFHFFTAGSHRTL